MTTAARPTFCPAKGSKLEAKAPSLQYSSRDQPAHKNLKFRQSGQSSLGDVKDIDFKSLVKSKEPGSATIDPLKGTSFDTPKHVRYPGDDEGSLQALGNGRSDQSGCDDSEDDIGDRDGPSATRRDFEGGDDSEGIASLSDEEDDEELLMKELAKIKQEREEKKQKMQLEAEQILTGNPLRFQERGIVKKDWTQDIVFTNQAKRDGRPKRRFINDLVRSDFHKKFMDKYFK